MAGHHVKLGLEREQEVHADESEMEGHKNILRCDWRGGVAEIHM